MDRKKLHDFYQKVAQNTADFCNEEGVNTEDLINISSSLVCFAVDLLNDNTSLSEDRIRLILEEAVSLSLLSKEDLDIFLKDKEDKQAQQTPEQIIKNNKLLN